MTTGIQSVVNFLVPAQGTTNAYMMRQAFSATPTFQDFNSVSLNGIAFRPYGVIIDNSGNSDPLNVLINEMSFTISCPANSQIQMPFPAPMNCTANITGNGTATVIFVDYPVVPVPAESSGGGSIPNPLPVTLPAKGSLTAAVTSSTTTGSTTAGARMVSFNNTGAAAATVAGGSLPAGQSLTFEAPVDSTIGAIAYTATGTTLLIATLA